MEQSKTLIQEKIDFTPIKTEHESAQFCTNQGFDASAYIPTGYNPIEFDPIGPKPVRNWDFAELEDQAIKFLLRNPEKGINIFCQEMGIAYRYFAMHCPIKEIKRKVKALFDKKNEEKFKNTKAEIEKQIKVETIDNEKLFKVTVESFIKNTAYTASHPVNYRSTYDAMKNQLKIMKFLKEMIDNRQNSKPDESYKAMTERIQELIDINKKKYAPALPPCDSDSSDIE